MRCTYKLRTNMVTMVCVYISYEHSTRIELLKKTFMLKSLSLIFEIHITRTPHAAHPYSHFTHTQY